MHAKRDRECPVCHRTVAVTGPLDRLYRHMNRHRRYGKWHDVRDITWCAASLLSYKEAEAMVATPTKTCHRCGRLITLMTNGRFPRHNKATLMEGKDGKKFLQILPRVKCDGSKLTPDLTRTWYSGSSVKSTCRCEEDKTKYKTPLDRVVGQFGMHGPPTPRPVLVSDAEATLTSIISGGVKIDLVWEKMYGNLTRESYDQQLHDYAELVREKRELLEDAQADAKTAELNLMAFIHDHKPRRKT